MVGGAEMAITQMLTRAGSDGITKGFSEFSVTLKSNHHMFFSKNICDFSITFPNFQT